MQLYIEIKILQEVKNISNKQSSLPQHSCQQHKSHKTIKKFFCKGTNCSEFKGKKNQAKKSFSA